SVFAEESGGQGASSDHNDKSNLPFCDGNLTFKVSVLEGSLSGSSGPAALFIDRGGGGGGRGGGGGGFGGRGGEFAGYDRMGDDRYGYDRIGADRYGY